MIARLSIMLQAWERTQSRIIIKGAGDNFCGGTDLKWLLGSNDPTIKSATHCVPSARLEDLKVDLCHCKVEDIEACCHTYSETLGEFSLTPFIKDIDYCFSADTVEEIFARLTKIDNPWSNETLKLFEPLCPTSLKVALRALQLWKDLDLKQAFILEHRVLSRCINSYNGKEGLRSLLLERTDRPNWLPKTVAEVRDAMVDSYFEPLPEGEELMITD
ncbi:3-hydroxyisobutyryl-CoA hydrolase, mitochondrial-like [Cydia fagiglandana]|uniref:3-hydroxyisobutyryl-CoA hydrolase, mitochondrial-like n=1 Tax=Cydia fagiglandana TaxID=1458189 RepID=UPI002FEE3BB5